MLHSPIPSVVEPAKAGGRLTFDELAAAIQAGEIDTVIVCMTDLQGRLIGKRLTGRFFLETKGSAQLFCDYLLATDMEMTLVPGYEAASWERGYGDFALVPDMATLRRIPWLPGTALVLADVADRAGAALAHSPRQMLKRQIERLAGLGYVADMAAELEFYLFDESFTEARNKEYRGIKPSSWYPEDGHIFQTSKDEPFIRTIRNMMEAADIPIEGSKAEWSGPIRHEHGPARAQCPLAAATPAHLQLLLAIEPSQLLLVHHDALAVQHDVDPAIAEPPALRRHDLHRLAQQSIVRPGARVAHRRAVDLQGQAHPTLTHRMHRAGMSHRLPLRIGRHHFFCSDILQDRVVEHLSASSFLRRAFSSSRIFSRRACDTSIPPYFALNV